MIFKKNTITIEGRKFFYWEKNHSHKQAIVVLHGFPGNHRVVMDMAKRLGNARIIIPDLPACGESESLKNEHILKNYTEWLEGFLNSISVESAIVIGYSFGSRIAITFSALHPEKVQKLVLITPVVKPDSIIANLASLEYEIAEKLPVYMQKTWLSNKIYHGASNFIIFKSASKKRRQYLISNDAKEIKRLDPKANLELFDEFFRFDHISKGSKITIKTLVIAGDKDEIATVGSVEKLCERFPNYELKVIKNSGHIVVAERPKRVARIISDFLGKQKPGLT